MDQQTENQLSALLEHSRDIVIVINAGGSITFVNNAIRRSLGYLPDDMIGENAFDYIHSDDRETVWEHFTALIKNPQHATGQVQYRFEHKDNGWVWLESVGSNQTDTSLDGYVINCREITERIARERELRRAERAMDASGHAIYITDAKGQIEYVNPAFTETTGYTLDEVRGENPRILQSGEMPSEYYETLWETIFSGDVWEEEIINRRKTGELYYAYQTIAPVETQDNDVDSFVAIQKDITERKALENELRESVRQHHVIDRVLRHNFRNDLNIIISNAEVLLGGCEDERASMASTIVDTSWKLLTTAENARKITRLIREPRSPEPIDLGSIIETSVSSVREQYPDSRITVDSPEGVTVNGTTDLGWALTELLANAFRHSDRDKPEVELRVGRTGEMMELRISDGGPRIPEEEILVVTQEREIEPGYHGTGLGLRLVYLIVQQSGGTVEFEENEEGGNIVTIGLTEA